MKGGWGYRVWGCIYVFNAGVTSSRSKCPRLHRPSPPSQPPPTPKSFARPGPLPLNIPHRNFYKSFGCVYVHCTPCFYVRHMTRFWGPLHDPAPLRMHRPKNGLNISTLFFLKNFLVIVIFVKSLILKDF